MKVSILHFDDEVNTVSCIPNSLYNYFVRHRPQWVNEKSVVYKRFVESFTICPSGHPAITIQYHLSADVKFCEEILITLDPATDIAIFDLMRENTRGGIEPVGKELYAKAKALRMDASRLFMLTGFPSLFDKEFSDMVIPEEQKLLKPIFATALAARLAQLLPGMR